MSEFAVTTVAHVIHLAVAPVFMLAGIGSILGVMNHRLSRVMDRVRVLEAKQEKGNVDAHVIERELAVLAKRASLVIKAITCCSVTALLIAAVIATLFLAASMKFNAGSVVSFFFITAMLSFIVGLLIFLREVFIAMANMRIGEKLIHRS